MKEDGKTTSSPVAAEVSLRRLRFCGDAKDYDREDIDPKDFSEWLSCNSKEEEAEARNIAKAFDLEVQFAVFSHEGKLLWEIGGE